MVIFVINLPSVHQNRQNMHFCYKSAPKGSTP